MYDNTVSARTYLSYIAEQAGGAAIIGRDGKLYIRTIRQNTINFDINLFGDYVWGDKFKVSKVSYEDGIQNYKFGDETANTIYINQDNMYIVDSQQIEKIYNKVKDLEVYSFEGETIIDPAYDIGDILVIEGKQVIYQGELEYQGKFKANIKSKIQAKTEQESMQTKGSTSAKIKRVQSQIDQANGKITQLTQETAENTQKLTKVEQDVGGIKQNVSEVQKKVITVDKEVNELKTETISSVDVMYALSNSETVAPTIGWSTTAPEWTIGKYMWQKTITTYVEGTVKETSATCIQGAMGADGLQGPKGEKGETGAQGPQGPAGTSVTIKSTSITYQASSSGTTTPTGTWSTNVPTLANGQYLWTKTVVTYSDNKSTTAYSVAYKGTNGINGEKGDKGDIGPTGPKGTNGTSSYTHVRYSNSSDGPSMDTNPTGKSYIGIYTGTSSTAPTTASSYTWAKFKGDTGATGATGKDGNGINSITYYYAVTSNQTVPVASAVTSTSIPALTATNKYLWQKEVIDFTDTTVADKTTVVLLAVYGDKGNTGATGVGVSKLQELYYLHTSDTTAPAVPTSHITDDTGGAGKWTTKCPTWVSGQYYWTCSEIMYTNNTYKWTTAILASGLNNANSVADGANNIAEITNKNIQDTQADLTNLDNQLNSKIEDTSNELDSVKEIIETMGTTFEQTSNSFTATISNIIKEIEKTNNQVTENETEQSKYLRYYIDPNNDDKGTLELGESESPFKTKITNEEMAFTQNGYKVAYINGNKLYITTAEILNALIIGNFGFTPMSNGSLSFGKVK